MANLMMEPIKLELGAVQETLLLPLLARAVEAQWENSLLQDDKAVELVHAIDFDKHKAAKQMSNAGMLGLAVRGYKMDNAIKEYLKVFPEAKVLDIGAGLDTTFFRCDNGTVQWFDLDLPDSMEIRKKLLPIPNERVTYIEKSMFDFSWIDDIGDISKGLFIIIPGVLPYFKKAQVKDFFVEISSRLIGAEIMFDTTSEMARFFISQRIKKAGMEKASLGWGIMDAHEMEKWSSHIRVVNKENFFKNIDRSKNYPFATRFLMEWNDILSATQLFHLRFV
jgi:O-methyltransferase involved in polyketide biosynthesis